MANIPAELWQRIAQEKALSWLDVRNLGKCSSKLHNIIACELKKRRRNRGPHETLVRLTSPLSQVHFPYSIIDFDCLLDNNFVVLKQMQTRPYTWHKHLIVDERGKNEKNFFSSSYQYILSLCHIGGCCLLADGSAVVALERKIVRLDRAGRLIAVLARIDEAAKKLTYGHFYFAQAIDGNLLLARPSANEAGKCEVQVISSKALTATPPLRKFGLSELRNVRAIAVHPRDGDVYVAQPNLLVRYSYEGIVNNIFFFGSIYIYIYI